MYSKNHVLIRLIENWITPLDKNLFIGTVLLDLPKAFHYIPHNLLIAKLHASGLSFNMVSFLNLQLKDQKQNLRINNVFSALQNILSGIPQGSILGPILFNIFLNDLFLSIKKLDQGIKVWRRSFLNGNILSSVHSLAAILNFCFYCRECKQNVSFVF